MSTKLKIVIGVVVGVPLLLVAYMLVTGTRPLSVAMPETYQVTDGYAVGGLDVVTYFDNMVPKGGSPAYKTEWKGVTWRFQTATNRARFLAKPEKYAPQCLGYCASAAENGLIARSDHHAYAVDNGKLYLFSDKSVRDQSLRKLDALEKVCATFK